MPWVLLAVAIGLLAVVVLLLVAVSLYKRVRGLARTVGAGSRQVAELTPGLAIEQPAPRERATSTPAR